MNIITQNHERYFDHHIQTIHSKLSDTAIKGIEQIDSRSESIRATHSARSLIAGVP